LKSESAQCQPATGVFFARQTAESLAEAIGRFAKLEGVFDPRAIRANAERFDAVHFRNGIRREVTRVIEDESARNHREAGSG
jgi:hypothetical protein